MEKKYHLLFALCSAFIVFTALTANAAAVNFNMRVCMDWRSDFSDAELGEDYLDDNALAYWSDAFGYYRISYASNDSTIDEGYLDTNGCSPYITATDGVQYRVRQGTRFSRNDAWVYLNTDDTPYDENNYPEPADWPHGAVLYSTYYTPSGHSSGQNYTYDAPLGYQGYYSNMGAIVQRYMRYTNTLDIPANTHLHLRGFTAGSWYSGEDDNGSGTGTDQRITIRYWGSDHSAQKFRVGHEIGHAVGSMTTDRMSGSDYGLKLLDADGFCYCVGEGAGTDPTHCLNSKEHILAAENEGWAHFISAELFNVRDDSDGWFGSYRDVTEPSPYPNGPGTTTHTWPWGVDLTLHKFWMEYLCDETTMANRGVEWDWLLFFYQLWSNGTYRLEISEMKDIWPNNGSADADFNWTNSVPANPSIRKSAETYLGAGSSDFTNFTSVAASNGVDHGYGG